MMTKKALSELVGYVLLVVIAVTISVLVYAGLKSYLPAKQVKCPDGMSLIIEDYQCAGGSILNLDLRNAGTFNADGFIIRISNKTGRDPIYPIRALGEYTKGLEQDKGKILFDESMAPGIVKNFSFDYSEFKSILELSIEPLRVQENQILLCEGAVIKQEIVNC